MGPRTRLIPSTSAAVSDGSPLGTGPRGRAAAVGVRGSKGTPGVDPTDAPAGGETADPPGDAGVDDNAVVRITSAVSSMECIHHHTHTIIKTKPPRTEVERPFFERAGRASFMVIISRHVDEQQ